MDQKKCVLVLDSNLPVGVLANASAVLGVSIGKLMPSIVGDDMKDNEGHARRGITTQAIPILKADGDKLRIIREKMKAYEPDLIVVDITGATRTTRSYEEYVQVMEVTPADDTDYLGIGIHGDKKVVNKFTGDLGLLR